MRLPVFALLPSTSRALIAGAFASTVIAGCAASPQTEPDEPLITEPPSARSPARARSGASDERDQSARPAERVPSGPPGTIARAELVRFLAEQSPGTFLAHVEVEPVLRPRRAGKTADPKKPEGDTKEELRVVSPNEATASFVGWRINVFFPDDPVFSLVDLRPGDVVTRINGSAIERPEQLSDVWQGAGARGELTVEYARDGASRKLSWKIAD